MTLIVSLVRDGKIYMGADSSANCEETKSKQPISNPKAQRVGDMLIGCTGSQRVRDLLFHAFKPPTMRGSDPDTYMRVDVAGRMSDLLVKHGAIKDEAPYDMGGEVVVGFRGNLYYVDSDFSVVTNADPFVVAGSAANIALGIVAALTDKTRMAPRKVIEYTMARCNRYCYEVSAPYNIHTL